MRFQSHARKKSYDLTKKPNSRDKTLFQLPVNFATVVAMERLILPLNNSEMRRSNFSKCIFVKTHGSILGRQMLYAQCTITL